MTEGEERQPGVASQSKLIFHSGLEWCMREILKEVANLSVEVSSASREATEWEAWDGVAKLNPTAARKQKPSKKELYLWRRLDEVDKEIANEEKRAVEKKRRGVERARHRKGAGVNQPSILSKFNKVASSSLEQAVADEVRIASVTQVSSMKSVAVIKDEKKSDEILSVAQLSSQCSMESKPVCFEMGSIRAESVSVAPLIKPSVCSKPRGDIKAGESQEVANTKASQIAKSKGGIDGVRGVTGAGRERGDFEATKTDTIIMKKKSIHPKVKRLHTLFEGDEVRTQKNLQNFTENSPMKRKLTIIKNTSNLVHIFSRNIESNPARESESLESPAKRRKGGGTGVGDLLED